MRVSREADCKPAAQVPKQCDICSVSVVMTAEFDLYATGYCAGMEHPLKRALGGSRSAYLRLKLHWVNRQLVRLAAACSRSPRDLSVLEVGCADGALLRGLRDGGFCGFLHGCDISQQMVACAARQDSRGRPIAYQLSTNAGLPYAEGQFDAVILSAVIHHVPIADRTVFFDECLRVVRTDGELLIIEHNPWNPVTRFVVATTRIDRNARLISAGRLQRLLQPVGQTLDRVEHMMFFPPRFARFDFLDRWMSWFPCGGQYAAVCRKNGTRSGRGTRQLCDSMAGDVRVSAGSSMGVLS